MQKEEKYYKEMRRSFIPEKLKTIFIFESPPLNGGYFYDIKGRPSEILFRAMMRILGITPKTKDEGLRAFQNKGFLIVDSTYKQVNKIQDKEANAIIENGYHNLLADLNEITKGNKKVPLVLVKSNICNILEPKLTKDGFNVLNHGLIIPFPLHYHLKTFESKVRSLLK